MSCFMSITREENRCKNSIVDFWPCRLVAATVLMYTAGEKASCPLLAVGQSPATLAMRDSPYTGAQAALPDAY
jgi:hypothetical protein